MFAGSDDPLHYKTQTWSRNRILHKLKHDRSATGWHGDEASGAGCGSLEGMDLVNSQPQEHRKRMFCYDWGAGYIAPFKSADLPTARAAIQAVTMQVSFVSY